MMIGSLLQALAAVAGVAAAVPGADCPLAHEPYSSRTPLYDLLIDPAARGELERVAPELLKTSFGEWSTQTPSFATILSPQMMLEKGVEGPSQIAALDAALARVKLTPAAVRARCARYDTEPPSLPAELRRPAILVYGKITGFRHPHSPEAAREVLRDVAAQRGWSIVYTDNGAVFNPEDLARFDVVVWNNVSGDGLTLSQRAAFRSWLEAGGGFAGIHASGGDPVYFWDWYADELIGARFTGHPLEPQFQSARVVVEDRANPITAGLGDGWTMTEEWYSFAASPRAGGARILATLDESTYAPVGPGGQDLRMGDHPIAWTRCVGRGRSFFTAIGHLPETYRQPAAFALLEQGIAWAMQHDCRR